MDNCIFCKIIKGEAPSNMIYEDDIIKVIMSIDPQTNGHLLVLPKDHVVNIFDIKDETVSHMIKVVREKLYPLLKEKLDCKGLTIAQNNEYGQEIKHYHMHLMPRYENDMADIKYDKSNILPVDEVFDKLK